MIVDADFTEHWKTRMLVGLLDNDEAAPIYVLRIWAHCQNRKQSIFHDLNTEALKALCRFSGAADKLESALISAGFIRRKGKNLEAINWSKYNASLVASWNNGRKGGRPQSENNPKPTGSPTDPPTGPREEKRREEKSREEKNGSKKKRKRKPPLPVPLPIPPVLDTPEFRAAWKSWLKHRIEIKFELTPEQEAQQLKELEHLGSVAARELIEHTIAMGWRGLRDGDGKDVCKIAKAKNPASRVPTPEDDAKWSPHGDGSDT
jgi:hypothetical protein